MLRIIPDPYIEYSLESIKSAILSDSKQSCISDMNRVLNNLESDSTQYQESIKVFAYSHTYIYEYLNIYIYAYPHMSNPEIAQECGLALPGIMTDCKNLFLQELILRFMGCKSKNNLFLFFDRVQGRNKLTLDNGIIIVYNVDNNQIKSRKDNMNIRTIQKMQRFEKDMEDPTNQGQGKALVRLYMLEALEELCQWDVPWASDSQEEARY